MNQTDQQQTSGCGTILFRVRPLDVVPLLGLLVLQLMFLRWPEIDLWFSGLFYRPDSGFFLAQNPLVQISYRIFASIHFFVAAGLIWAWIASWVWRRRGERRLRRALLFLMLVLAIGPGLVVNEVLKAHSGRARPLTVTEFAGERSYTGAFQPAAECRRNCSFVSGHAGMGFFLIAVAWLTRRRRWFWLGMGLGALVGFGRILQGAHFLSDVIFAFWVVYGVAILCACLVLGHARIRPLATVNARVAHDSGGRG